VPSSSVIRAPLLPARFGRDLCHITGSGRPGLDCLQAVPINTFLNNPHHNVQASLTEHPRFHIHFTPASSSWLNMVERWFRDLTEKAIRRGVFLSVTALIAAIEYYLKANNDNPKPFVWTATAEEILEKVRRGRVVLRANAS